MINDKSQTFIAELNQYWRNEQWMKNEKSRFGFIVRIVEGKQEQRYMSRKFPNLLCELKKNGTMVVSNY